MQKSRKVGKAAMRTMFIFLFLLMMGTVPAWAVLGEYESSISVDQEVLQGQRREEARTGYRLHTITSANGAVVKEFVSPAGKVFGISWQAPNMPRLDQLLGANMTELEQALQGRKGHRGGPLVVETPKLVFVSGGHSRFFIGRAYVPSLVPAGVSMEGVR
jgi:hypothetical protein